MPADRPARRRCRGPVEVQLESELEGIRFELIRADIFRRREVHMVTSNAIVADMIYNLDEHLRTRFEMHMVTSNAIVADMIYNLDEHMRTRFETFSWPIVLNERVLEICNSIWTLTMFVDLTLEFIPKKDGFFRRIGNYIRSVVVNGLRTVYGLD